MYTFCRFSVTVFLPPPVLCPRKPHFVGNPYPLTLAGGLDQQEHGKQDEVRIQATLPPLPFHKGWPFLASAARAEFSLWPLATKQSPGDGLGSHSNPASARPTAPPASSMWLRLLRSSFPALSFLPAEDGSFLCSVCFLGCLTIFYLLCTSVFTLSVFSVKSSLIARKAFRFPDLILSDTSVLSTRKTRTIRCAPLLLEPLQATRIAHMDNVRQNSFFGSFYSIQGREERSQFIICLYTSDLSALIHHCT